MYKFILLLVFATYLFLSCSINEDDKDIIYNFKNDLDGWEIGTSGKELDSATWFEEAGQPPGCVKLDGSDFGSPDHEPNSWIYKEISLPDKCTTLTFLTSAHNRENANAELRVRLIDESQVSNILLDWELANNGIEGELVWIEKTVHISSYAGQNVILHFEQGDNDIGIHEQRYIDKIRIY
jgi:hypothetical protein